MRRVAAAAIATALILAPPAPLPRSALPALMGGVHQALAASSVNERSLQILADLVPAGLHTIKSARQELAPLLGDQDQALPASRVARIASALHTCKDQVAHAPWAPAGAEVLDSLEHVLAEGGDVRDGNLAAKADAYLVDAWDAALRRGEENMPDSVRGLPRLVGRVDVELKLRRPADGPPPEEGAEAPCVRPFSTGACEATVMARIDGVSAPVNAGTFVDLINRRFYVGLPLRKPPSTKGRAWDVAGDGLRPWATGGRRALCSRLATRAAGLALLSGPDVPEYFIEPSSRQPRLLPLEVVRKGSDGPSYGTYEPRLALGQTRLPFTVQGAVGMYHREGGRASSSFFITLPKSPTISAASGEPADLLYGDPRDGPDDMFAAASPLAFLDGRFTCIGYVVDGVDVLASIEDGDTITGARVLQTPPLLASDAALDDALPPPEPPAKLVIKHSAKPL